MAVFAGGPEQVCSVWALLVHTRVCRLSNFRPAVAGSVAGREKCEKEYDKVSKTTSDFGFGFRLFSAFFYSFQLFSHGAIKDFLRLFRFFSRLFFSTSDCTVINFLFLLKNSFKFKKTNSV